MLQYLNASKITTVIVSNKEQSLLESTLEQIGWTQYIQAFWGIQKGKPHKPDPSLVDLILKDLGMKNIPREKVFFAGDSISNDMICTIQAKVIPVWLSQYSVDELIFDSDGPEILQIDNCQDLINLIKSLE